MAEEACSNTVQVQIQVLDYQNNNLISQTRVFFFLLLTSQVYSKSVPLKKNFYNPEFLLFSFPFVKRFKTSLRTAVVWGTYHVFE